MTRKNKKNKKKKDKTIYDPKHYISKNPTEIDKELEELVETTVRRKSILDSFIDIP